MIDFIKFEYRTEEVDALLNNVLFGGNIRHTSSNYGELLFSTAKYKNMKFEVHPSGLVKVTGSLHKLYNDGEHNYNDFIFSDLVKTLKMLSDNFKVPLEKSIIHHIEVGVNILVPHNPTDMIDSLLGYKFKAFQPMDIRNANASGVHCDFDEYIIKIYNKSLQYSHQQNILRFELKILSMRRFHPTGIISLADLFDSEKLTSIEGLLLNILNDITIDDPTIPLDQVTTSVRKVLRKVRSAAYWKQLNVKKTQRAYYKKKFQSIITSIGSLNYKDKLSNYIHNTMRNLINDCKSIGKKIDTISSYKYA